MGIAGFGLDVGNLNRLLVAAARPSAVPGLGWNTGLRRRSSARAGGAPCSETTRNASPWRRNISPRLASQMRVALASMAWKTGRVRWASPRSRAGHRRSRSAGPEPRRVSFSGPRWLREGVQSPSFHRTKTTNAGLALRPLARQGHLVGTVTGPLRVGGPPQGWRPLS